MTQPFKQETKNYRSRPVETPYQRVRQIWDQRLGSALVQAKNWRFMAIMSGLSTLILLILLIIVLRSQNNYVYVAEVAKDGAVKNVAMLKRSYQPTLAQKEFFLSMFIQMLRGVPLDPVVAKKAWTDAYSFLSRPVADKLSKEWQQNNPAHLLGKKTVSVVVDNINPISDNTFNMTWTETTLAMNDQKPVTTRYSGVVTTTTIQPTSQKQIMKNPLGLYIINFNFSRS